MRASLRVLLGVAICGLLVCIAAALSARIGFPFELFSHFTPQLAVISAFLLGAAIALRWRRIAIALVAVTALMGARWAWIPPFMEPSGGQVTDKTLTVASFNMWGREEAAREFAAYAAQNRADILALSEAYNISHAELVVLFAEWPHTITVSSARVIGAALDRPIYLFSRYPLSRIDTTGLTRPERPILAAIAQTPSGPVRIAAVHPFPPYSPDALSDRNATFSALTDLAPEDGRYIVMGDLNVTPWSPGFALLPGRRVGDPRFAPTWVSRFPLLGLPLDHVLTGTAFEAGRVDTAPAMGSDHRAVLAQLHPGR